MSSTSSALSKTVLGVTRTSLGLLDEKRQRAEIFDRCSARDRLQLRFIDMADEGIESLSELSAVLQSMNTRKLVLWSVSVLAPLLVDAEDLLAFLGLLERRSVELYVLDSGLAIGQHDKVSLSALESLWALMKLNRRRENANASRAKAALRGAKPGQKRKVDPSEVSELRREGLTIQEIADQKGVSTTSVRRALQEADKLSPN